MYRNKTYRLGVLLSSLVVILVPHPTQAAMAAGPGAPMASSFPGPLWQLFTPAGGTVAVANAHLTLTVPAGNNHDTLLPANNAVRVLQRIGNYDFDVAIKIDSPITATDPGTSRGLMVLADSQDFITFAIATDGTNISLTARTVTAGVATTVFNQATFNEYHNPICLRLTRTGTAYTAYYSPDGVVWIQAASFVDARVPTLIGPFASNYNNTPARAVAVVMAINWFDIL